MEAREAELRAFQNLTSLTLKDYGRLEEYMLMEICELPLLERLELVKVERLNNYGRWNEYKTLAGGTRIRHLSLEGCKHV